MPMYFVVLLACDEAVGFRPGSKTELTHAISDWMSNRDDAAGTYGIMSMWDVSSITDMAELFKSYSYFNEAIGTWNTGSVTTINCMFCHASAFNQHVSDWNTGSVTDFSDVFYKASSFNKPLGTWNTRLVSTMSCSFCHAAGFNQAIGLWNTGRVATMKDMFYVGDKSGGFNQPLDQWNTGSVTAMESMFYGVFALNQPLGNWNTGSVINMDCMFCHAYGFDHQIGKWNTGHVATITYMFFSALAFNQPLGDWNTGSVTELVQVFDGASRFNNAVADWNTGSVTDMAKQFYWAYAFNQPLGDWNTGSVTSMTETFEFSDSFNHPVAKWNTGSVTDMEYMFYQASNFNQYCDWDTRSVTNMDCMFCYAFKFNQVVGHWSTSSVTIMKDLFYSSATFNQPVESWNIGRVIDMSGILSLAVSFCQSLASWAHSDVYNEAVRSLDDSGKICNACSDYFHNCSSCNRDGCLECKNSTYLHEDRCVEFCPALTFGNMSSNTCTKCEPSCETCVNDHVCTQCTDSKFLYDANCFYFCPLGTFARGSGTKGKYCSLCESDCSSCSSESTCLLCTNSRYLHNGDCLDECLEGSVASGSGVSGRSCQPPGDCPFYTNVSETGSCEVNWVFVAGMLFTAVLFTMFALRWCIRLRVMRSLSDAIDKDNEHLIETALKRAMRVHLNESLPQIMLARRKLRVLQRKYTDYEALLEILDRGEEIGSMKLVRGSWLRDRQRTRRFRRQQELPKHAFWSPNAMRSQFSAINIVAISYCWLHPINPDPKSEHLRVLQRAIKLRLLLKGPGNIQDLAIFLDYLSIPQHGEDGDENDPVIGKLRTQSEQEAFISGLMNVNLVYGSQLTDVWMLQWVPEDQPRKYMDRGWPFFEQAISKIIKAAPQLIDIKPHVLDTAVGWIDVHDKGRIGRTPPLIPSLFSKELESKSFTEGITDQRFVQAKYERTFMEMIGTANTLWFVGLGWTDRDAEVFSEIFPFATKLERLLLAENEFTVIGASLILKKSKACNTLQYVDLAGNDFEEYEFFGLQKEWESLSKPIEGLRFEARAPETRQRLAAEEAMSSRSASLVGHRLSRSRHHSFDPDGPLSPDPAEEPCAALIGSTPLETLREVSTETGGTAFVRLNTASSTIMIDL